MKKTYADLGIEKSNLEFEVFDLNKEIQQLDRLRRKKLSRILAIGNEFSYISILERRNNAEAEQYKKKFMVKKSGIRK